MLWCGSQSFFFLLEWRIFSFGAGSSVDVTPSDRFPGGDEGTRALKPLAIGGVEEGPDGIFLFRYEVLFEKSEDGSVISFFFDVFYVNCNNSPFNADLGLSRPLPFKKKKDDFSDAATICRNRD